MRGRAFGSRRLRICVALAGLGLLLAPAASAAPFNPSPDATWQTDGRVRSILYVGNTVYIAGEFTQVVPPGGGTGVVRNHVAAFDVSSGQLLPWDPNADGIVWSLDVAGGLIYMGGEFANVGGVPRPFAAAVDASTALVSAWNPTPDGNVNVVKVSPTGAIVLGGAFGKVGGKVRNSLAQVTTDGTVLQWNPSVKQVSGSTCPPRCAPFVVSLAFSPDGTKLYFSGHFGLVGGVGRNNAAAVTFATAALLPWNPDVFGQGIGKNPNQANKVWKVELGPDRAFICGDFWSLDGFQRHPNLAAVDLTDGHLIPGFDATTDGNTPACLYRNGLLYIGGHFQYGGPNSAWVFNPGQKAELTGPGSQVRNHVAAVDANTGAIDAWNPNADSILGLHVLAQSPTQIAAGGDFTRIGGRDQAHLGLFSLDTTPPDTLLDTKPPAVSSSAAASFGFHSTEGGSSFLCSLDGAAPTTCTSPASLSGLPDGAHTFSVGAIDPAGNPDPSPASYSWTIDTVAPGAPTGLTTTSVTSSRVDLSWTAPPDPDVATYQVLRDGYLIGTTPTPGYADKTVAGPITYSYTVVAVDQAGNASPATDPLTVDIPSPTAPPIFADGFEGGDLSQWTTSNGLAVQTQDVFSGVSAARATPAGVAAFAQKQLPSTVTELFYDLHFKVLNQNATKITLGSFKTATNVGILSLYTSSLGKLGYRNDRTAMNVVSTTAVSTASWHDLQIHLLVNGTASEVEVWLDGARVTDLARTESLGTVPVGRVQLGDDATGKTYDVAYDQVVVASSFVVPPPPPGAPTGVTATAGDQQATVSWTAPTSSGGGPITGYTITVSPGGSTIRAGGLTTSTIVSGLTNGTTYTFTVTATNDYGTGPASAPSNAVVPASVPGPPLNVTASAGDGMAVVTWSAPASDGGRPITGYAVTSSPDGVVTVASAGARSATVIPLTNGTTYTFTVTATNAMGTGPASAPSNAVTPQGNVTRNVTVSDAGFSPASTTAKQGDTIRWNFTGTVSHSAKDGSGLGLYDSGPMSSGASYSYTFGAAGAFTVGDAGSTNTSQVSVPIAIVPNAGTITSTFAVTWATAAAPAGYVYDVQIQKPGATAFASWQKGVSAANGLFASGDPAWVGVGTYQFRSRLRNVATSAASGWSPSRSISVT